MGEISSSDSSKEIISWHPEVTHEEKKKKPEAKLKRFLEALREAVTEKTVCSMFCGGKRCKYEGVSYWSQSDMELNGIFSNWITDNIMAMSRPNPTAISKYKLFEQFKKANILSIVNLQRPGEHASCGEGLHESGFSYNPQEFMENEIFHYNFGWDDYSVGSHQNILDMTKVLQFALTEGKIAVHCHAGLGRTGVLICCYLIYANRMSADEAINFVRSKRKSSVQTRKQIHCIQDFEKFLQPLRIVFSTPSGKNHTHAFTLDQYLNRQRHIMHGEQGRHLRYLPYIIHVTVTQLLVIAKRLEINSNPKTERKIPRPLRRKGQSDKRGGSMKRSISSNMTEPPEQRQGSNLKKKWMSHDQLTVVHEDEETTPSYASSSTNSMENILNSNGGKYLDISGVLEALLLDEYADTVMERVEEFELNLNADWDSWGLLSKETDPTFLSAVMWKWIDNLKQPILLQQDLPKLLDNDSQNPTQSLQRLKKSCAKTTRYFAEMVSKLEPMPREKKHQLCLKVLSALTQCNMVLEYDSISNQIQNSNANGRYARSMSSQKLLHYFSGLVEECNQ